MTLAANAYCTVAEFRAHARIGDTGDDLIHEYVINAASRMIDRYTGRRFWQDGSVVAREYYPDDTICVQVDDISTTTGLIVKTDTAANGTFSTTLTITTDFLLHPLNAGDEVPARPWNEIRITSDSSYYFPTDSARPGVQVTAKFGYAAVPAEVTLAAIYQAQMLYGAGQNRGGIFPDGIPVSRYLHPQAQTLLTDFVKAPR